MVEVQQGDQEDLGSRPIGGQLILSICVPSKLNFIIASLMLITSQINSQKIKNLVFFNSLDGATGNLSKGLFSLKKVPKILVSISVSIFRKTDTSYFDKMLFKIPDPKKILDLGTFFHFFLSPNSP